MGSDPQVIRVNVNSMRQKVCTNELNAVNDGTKTPGFADIRNARKLDSAMDRIPNIINIIGRTQDRKSCAHVSVDAMDKDILLRYALTEGAGGGGEGVWEL